MLGTSDSQRGRICHYSLDRTNPEQVTVITSYTSSWYTYAISIVASTVRLDPGIAELHCDGGRSYIDKIRSDNQCRSERVCECQRFDVTLESIYSGTSLRSPRQTPSYSPLAPSLRSPGSPVQCCLFAMTQASRTEEEEQNGRGRGTKQRREQERNRYLP